MSSLLAGLSEYVVTIARSPEDLRLVMDVRRAVYVDEMRFRTAATLVDEFDSAATHFLVTVEGVAIGSARMVPGEMHLEGEVCFDISDWRKQGKVVEIGRLSVLPSYRRSLASVALFRAFYRHALAGSIRFFFVTGAGHVDRLYRSLGFHSIDGPKWYEPCNNISKAYILDLDMALVDWRLRRPRMLEYFLEPMDGIG